ncbi:Ulp1 family isopeptidase [Rickettsia endosymbiont of Rhinocyllus conicus]|uniref:Ulp1 family isopeptidase n=1 Tax=Rickettsia endosymbiont of Rhinocyllus conicus TaxID=3066252 RepID=UPI0031331E57
MLEANIDKNKFSIFHHASLEEPELLKSTLSAATENLILDNKPAIIPLNTGHEHWLILVAKQDEKDNVKFIYNDPNGNPIGDRPKVTQYINEVYPNAKIEDLKTRQQENKYDCGVFICDSAIKLANNKPILTTVEAANKGQELRNQHANMLMNKQPNKFQDLVASQRVTDPSRGR